MTDKLEAKPKTALEKYGISENSDIAESIETICLHSYGGEPGSPNNHQWSNKLWTRLGLELTCKIDDLVDTIRATNTETAELTEKLLRENQEMVKANKKLVELTAWMVGASLVMALAAVLALFKT